MADNSKTADTVFSLSPTRHKEQNYKLYNSKLSSDEPICYEDGCYDFKIADIKQS